MSTESLKQLSGIEMTDAEIDEFLRDQGHGVLSLTQDGESYGLPMSFGYDGERIFIQFIEFGSGSKKGQFREGTNRVCLTTYDIQTRFKWRSVVVTGPLTVVPEDEVEYAEETLDDNGWFPTIFPPTGPISDVNRYALDIEAATGRKGQEYQD